MVFIRFSWELARKPWDRWLRSKRHLESRLIRLIVTNWNVSQILNLKFYLLHLLVDLVEMANLKISARDSHTAAFTSASFHWGQTFLRTLEITKTLEMKACQSVCSWFEMIEMITPANKPIASDCLRDLSFHQTGSVRFSPSMWLSGGCFKV